MTEPAADSGREIPESIFADDDGTADARLAQALIKHSSGRGALADVVDALAYARVLVPVMAHGDERHVGSHGLEQDAVATTGVIAVDMPDGRAALPVFTDVDAMRAWNPSARPIPAEGPRAALAAVSEDWSVLVVNPGMESTVIPRPAVWALAQGETWHPVVVNGRVDAAVRQAVLDAVPTDGQVLVVDVEQGTTAEVAVVLHLAGGLSRDDVEVIVARVQSGLARSSVVADRVDSLQLRLVPSETGGPRR